MDETELQKIGEFLGRELKQQLVVMQDTCSDYTDSRFTLLSTEITSLQNQLNLLSQDIEVIKQHLNI